MVELGQRVSESGQESLCGAAIFPSDCIKYSGGICVAEHFGRVKAVYKDRPSNPEFQAAYM